MSASLVRLAEAPRRRRRIALGNFDGLHLGHRAVVAGADTVVTFDPHPLAVVAPERAPLVLSSLSRRAEVLERLGVGELVVIPFDDEVRRLSPEAFVDRVLVAALGVSHVSVGAHFRFGHRGAGGVEDLVRDQRFVARATPLVRVAGDVVSSTRIRALVERGALGAAAALLGEPFVLEAQATGHRPVAVGAGGVLRVPPGRAVPGPGVYDAVVAVNSGRSDPTTLVLGPSGPSDGHAARLVPWRSDGPPLPAAADGAAVRIAFRRRIRGEGAVGRPAADGERVPVGARSS